MRFLDAVNLAVTTVTWDHQHAGAGRPDLVHFSAAVKYSFLVVPGDQRTTAAAAADLVHFRRVKVDPVVHTLAEDPARLLKISMPKTLLGPSSIIARIVIGGRSFEPCLIQFDASRFDVAYEKIEDRDKFEFFKCFGVIFFETRPGRQIRMPSLGPHQRLDLQLLHLFDDAAAHDFHGRVITGKIGPVGSLPVFRRHRPVFLGHMKDPPPVL